MGDQPAGGNSIDLADGARIEWESKYPFRFTSPCYNSQNHPSVAYPDGGNSFYLHPGSRVDRGSNYPFQFTAPDYDAPITPCEDQTMENAL